jgi:hypothetical protein
MAREKWGFLTFPNTVPYSAVLSADAVSSHMTQFMFLLLASQRASCSVTASCIDSVRALRRIISYVYKLQKCLLCFPTWNIVTCILCMDFATAVHVLLLENTKGVIPTEGFRLEVFLLVLTRHCVILAVFQVLPCSLKGRWYKRLTHERTIVLDIHAPCKVLGTLRTAMTLV